MFVMQRAYVMSLKIVFGSRKAGELRAARDSVPHACDLPAAPQACDAEASEYLADGGEHRGIIALVADGDRFN